MHWIRWIPADEMAEPIWLPCPAADLLQALSLLVPVESGSAPRATLLRLLRGNPSLMVLALGRFAETQARAAANADELLEWAEAEFLPWLVGCELRQASLPEPQTVGQQAFWRRFLRARRGRPLRQALRQWLKRTTDLDRAIRRRWLRTWLPNDRLAEQLHWPCQGKGESRREIQRRWHAPPADFAILEGLWRLGQARVIDQDQRLRSLRRAKLDAMKELAYGASHEINNPLANIATRAQALLVDEPLPQRRRRLAVIYQQAMRAHEMISDMMLFAHPPALRLETVSIRLLLRRWLAEQESLWIETPGIQFCLRIGPGVDRCRLDPTQVRVALGCLVKNSVEAILGGAQAAGQIELRVDMATRPTGAAAQAGMQWSVWDDGPGLDERAGEHLFDPFFSGREAGRGLGLGLSKVWRIAQLHGGEIEWDRQATAGTRMVLWLPLEPEVPTVVGESLECHWPRSVERQDAA